MPLNISKVSAKGLVGTHVWYDPYLETLFIFLALFALERLGMRNSSIVEYNKSWIFYFFPLNFAWKCFTTYSIISILLYAALRKQLAFLTFCLEIFLDKSTSLLDSHDFFHITVENNIFRRYHYITRVSFHSVSNKISSLPFFMNSLLTSACHPSQTKHHTF